MQINTNTLEQQGVNPQQIRFVPISSNVSYLGTTVNYGIGTHTGVNAFSNNSQAIGNWTVSPQAGIINASQIGTTPCISAMSTTPCISTSQVGQIGTASYIPTPQFGQIGTTPYISASQFGQMGSGVFNGMVYNTQIPMGRSLMVQPTIDISETSSDIVVSAYVSNSAVNDLKLNVTDDSLTISGTLLNGTNQFVLNRTIPLSTSVRAEAVEATLQSGVVEIRLPKTEKFNRAAHTLSKDAGNVMISK
ncbi:Hsp20/alpha crystallin family protein [Clostridium sp. WILCCON 0269]|uniref:Hsp20/alpha crystallin family protein n=1 Tax=Candidatus Clostridium eludens TaxID=3381663 RepID=A0ABW8SM77_9CLOT